MNARQVQRHKPQRFVKKPVEVEAMQYSGWGTFAELQQFAPGVYYVPAGAEHSLRRENEADPSNGNFYEDRAPDYLVVPTLEGNMRADRGDWIIRGVKGEFYPCKPDIFSATYDPVD